MALGVGGHFLFLHYLYGGLHYIYLSRFSVMIGLADCNNFFVSCERTLRPDLEGKPVIVLSNNDGCAVARSNEAKALGIAMGAPLFKIRDIVERNHVAVFSNNYEFYHRKSREVHDLLRELAPAIEIYSVDEAFLDLDGIAVDSLDEMGHRISQEVHSRTGIPISVGISHNKTLAKIASKLCKHYPALHGSCLMHRPQDVDKVLSSFPIDDVWGIGRRFSALLQELNISTVADFLRLPESWVRLQMGIEGLRTYKELRGERCIPFSPDHGTKKSISNSHSFYTEIYDYRELLEQVHKFTSLTAEELRAQHSACTRFTVFAFTNRFHTDQPQQWGVFTIQLDPATNSTIELMKAADAALSHIFRKGYGYKKAGVTAFGFAPTNAVQGSFFDDGQLRDKHNRLMQVMDKINAASPAHNQLIVAAQGFGGVKAKREHLSDPDGKKKDEKGKKTGNGKEDQPA